MRKLVTRGSGDASVGVAVGVPDSAVGVELGIGVDKQIGVAVMGVVAQLNVGRNTCPSLHDPEKKIEPNARVIKAAKPNALPKFNAPFLTTAFLLNNFSPKPNEKAKGKGKAKHEGDLDEKG